jgi:hypothetical protein
MDIRIWLQLCVCIFYTPNAKEQSAMAPKPTPTERPVSAPTPNASAHDTVVTTKVTKADTNDTQIVVPRKTYPAGSATSVSNMTINKNTGIVMTYRGKPIELPDAKFFRLMDRHRGNAYPPLLDLWPLFLFFGFLGTAALTMGILALSR